MKCFNIIIIGVLLIFGFFFQIQPSFIISRESWVSSCESRPVIGKREWATRTAEDDSRMTRGDFRGQFGYPWPLFKNVINSVAELELEEEVRYQAARWLKESTPRGKIVNCNPKNDCPPLIRKKFNRPKFIEFKINKRK